MYLDEDIAVNIKSGQQRAKSL